MEKFLKIFFIVITLLGTWFQESKYGDMHFDIEEIHLHTIAGEEYVLLTEEISAEAFFDELIDDFRNSRRSTVQTKSPAGYSNSEYDIPSISDGIVTKYHIAFSEINTAPKQLLGYGLLYLCQLF